MDAFTTPSTLQPTEHLTGAVERVTFHSEETGFCVLRVKVRGHRDLVTVVGTAATITPWEYIEGTGWWVMDRTHGRQFKMQHLRVVPCAPTGRAAKRLSEATGVEAKTIHRGSIRSF
jgi:exodeoxyribonuclease V alpha subunit